MSWVFFWVVAATVVCIWRSWDTVVCTSSSFSRDVTKHKLLRPTHREAKQFQNVGVWSRKRFLAGPRKMEGWCPKTLNSSLFFLMYLKGKLINASESLLGQYSRQTLEFLKSEQDSSLCPTPCPPSLYSCFSRSQTGALWCCVILERSSLLLSS